MRKLVENTRDHGQEYLEHLWNLARKTKGVTTASGHMVHIVTNRAQSVEARSILGINSQSSVVVIAAAFFPEGNLAGSKLLMEKKQVEYSIELGFPVTPVMQVDWPQMDNQALEWAKTLNLP